MAMSAVPVAGNTGTGDVAIIDFDLGFLDNHFTLIVHGAECRVRNFAFYGSDGRVLDRVKHEMPD